MSKQKVGVIGLGSMGIGVARSLLAKGFEVQRCISIASSSITTSITAAV